MVGAISSNESTRERFESRGFIEIPGALSEDQVRRLTAAIDSLTSRHRGEARNVADIFGKHDAFLELLDLPSVLPVITEILGSNIWVNHSHFNFTPAKAEDDIEAYPNGYGWHRDGGAVHADLPWPPPLLSVKIGFYLTDLSKPGRGETYFIRDSHLTGEPAPAPTELPNSAFPMLVKPGTAVLFDRRLIHSMRSENRSDIDRRVVFVQYAFRWMAAVDDMNVRRLRRKCNPVQRQLLGLTTRTHTMDGAAGRSGRYYPNEAELPLAGGQPSSLVGRIGSRVRRAFVRR
jgi:ectoine hydroxylase-related dioxygenase (phytanoyl-CoA dioxygenase family)